MTAGVLLAPRHGSVGSKVVTGAAMLAVAAEMAFIAAGSIFGY